MSRQVLTKHLSLSEADGIVHAVYLSPSINLNIAQAIVKQRKEFTGKRAYPFLIEGTRLGAINKEARDYFSSPEGAEGVASAAFLVRSVFQATMLNFFLKVTRQVMPVRMFTDKQKAVGWLKVK